MTQPGERRVYVDMDGVLADYVKRRDQLLGKNPGIQYPQATYGFFTSLEPMPDALETMDWLAKGFDTWILTRPSVENPLCYTEKRVWVEQHLGLSWCYKLILAPDKALLKGDFLIDDHLWEGFEGEQLHFRSSDCPDWAAVREQLQPYWNK